MQQAIPLWVGIKPYRQIPFQYSLHILNTPCCEPVHKEFLAKEGTDPRRMVAEKLCAYISANACVIAYHSIFEKGRIEELSEEFPEFGQHLTSISENMRDLEVPFRDGAYYAKGMNDSSSIKYVLPALFPNDPQLDYKKLDKSVQNGSSAMVVFAGLDKQSAEMIERTRNALLAYCKLDTLAMVKILQRLYEAVDKI